MKFHVKFQGHFWYFEISIKDFLPFFATQPGERDQCATGRLSWKFEQICSTYTKINVENPIARFIGGLKFRPIKQGEREPFKPKWPPQWNIKNSPFGLTFLDRVINCKAALVLNACLLPLSESSISLVNTTKNFRWSKFMWYWNFVKLIFEISMKLIAIFKIVKFQNPTGRQCGGRWHDCPGTT